MSSSGGLYLSFSGVVHCDSEVDSITSGERWMVLDHMGRRAAPSASPIRAAKAFSIHDKAQCRGANLTLSHEAKALLTFGPKNGKDKVPAN